MAPTVKRSVATTASSSSSSSSSKVGVKKRRRIQVSSDEDSSDEDSDDDFSGSGSEDDESSSESSSSEEEKKPVKKGKKTTTTKKKKKIKKSESSDDESNSEEESDDSLPPGFPKTATDYRNTLIDNKAELYKDPPLLPVHAKQTSYDPKNRPFRALNGDYKFPGFPSFIPNRSPLEVLKGGSFGGGYFRDITSSVTGIHYKGKEVVAETLTPEWIAELQPINKTLTSKVYTINQNKYGVKCGGSLGMWESSGWISDLDPYGWFQWYCHFYRGRRSTDDERQIARWSKCAGVNGRFASQLKNKIIAANTTADDRKISPVIRQSLFHWGYEVTDEQVKAHKKKKGL